MVFQILFNSPGGLPRDFLNTDFYRACVASGLIPGNDRPRAANAEAGPEGGSDPSALWDERGDLAREMTVRVEGMWCSACAWVIEALLQKTKGVLEARVNFFSDLATVKYLPHLAPPRDILNAVARLGYGATLLEEQEEASRENRRLLLRLGLSCILTMNIMMISLALYLGFFHEPAEDAARWFAYPLWLLATPVVFYCGFPILARAWAGLRLGTFSMEALIAIGALSAYFYSMVMMAENSLHLYFDTAAMLVTLVLLGKYIEKAARTQAIEGIAALRGVSARKVRLCGGERESWVLPETAKPGDEFLVRKDERIPLDGIIVWGGAEVDESMLTGESRPLKRSEGDEVLGGSLLLSGEVRVRATRLAADSSVGLILSLMNRAIAEKSSVELLADRLTRWLVPVVLLLAVGTVLFTHGVGVPLGKALLRGLTVLVITCPCALAMAVPLAKVTAIAVAKKNGILVQNPEAFEKAKRLDTIIFDKTGTVTEGNYSLKEICSRQVPSDEALRRVASLEVHSDHFLAREILRTARDRDLKVEEPRALVTLPGLGVQGTLECGIIYVGNRRFMNDQGLLLEAAIDEDAGLREASGMTVIFFGWDHEVEGFLAFGDVARADAGQVFSELFASKYEVWLVSGDSWATTRAAAQQLGVRAFIGRALPGEKVELVRKLQLSGKRVGVVGDGMNDTPALAQADLGIALGGAPNSLASAADLTILNKDLSSVPDVLRLSAFTTGVMRENLVFSFVYNFLAIPLAISGVLNPVIAVLAMLVSSLTVIGNTLRITKSYPAGREEAGASDCLSGKGM